MYTIAFVRGSKLISVSTPSIAYAASVASYIPGARIWHKDKIVTEAEILCAQFADERRILMESALRLTAEQKQWADEWVARQKAQAV